MHAIAASVTMALSSLGATSTAPETQALLPEGSLEIRLTEPIRAGRVRVALHSDPQSFGGRGAPAIGAVFEPGELIEIEGIEPGAYALVVHHDENGNGALDDNFLGIPNEPVGFANGYLPAARPAFDETLVQIDGDARNVQRVQLRRPLGERGSIGVGLGAVVQGLPYRGASGARIQPIPIITYISDRVAVLGPRVQYLVKRGERVSVFATLRARFGAYDEDDADILRGMGDRDFAALGGVGLDIDLTPDTSLRVAYEHDLFGTIGGGEASASLARSFRTGDLTWAPFVGARYTSSDLVGHDFGVEPQFARADRPAYAPGDALYFEFGVTARAQLTDHLQFIGIINAQRFGDEVRNSPIVEDDTRVSGVFGLVFTL